MALRCTVDVGAAGRSPRAGRPSPSPGRRPPGRRGPLPPPAAGPPATLVTATARRHRARAHPPRPPPTPSPPLAPSSPSRRVARRLPGAGSQDDRDVGCTPGRPLDLDPPLGLLGRPRRLGSGEGEDLHALEPDLDVGPQHRSHVLARRAPGPPRPCPWAGGHRRRARSMTRRPSGSSVRCRFGGTCGGHATSPGDPSRCRARGHPVTWSTTSAGVREPPGPPHPPCCGATRHVPQEDRDERGHRAARAAFRCRYTRSADAPARGVDADRGLHRPLAPADPLGAARRTRAVAVEDAPTPSSVSHRRPTTRGRQSAPPPFPPGWRRLVLHPRLPAPGRRPAPTGPTDRADRDPVQLSAGRRAASPDRRRKTLDAGPAHGPGCPSRSWPPSSGPPSAPA